MKNRAHKLLLSTFALILFTLSSTTAYADPVAGTAITVENAGGYSYIEVEAKIENKKEKFWIAAPQTTVKKGDAISFNDGMWMPNFTSKALGRTFEKIMFVDRIMTESSLDNVKLQPPAKKEKPKNVKYKKPHKLSIKEIYGDRNALNGSKISVDGVVTKVSKNIMGTNWVHVEDGTGSPSDGSNKIIFKSQDVPNVGDKVTATGTVNVDANFGAGYAYKAIIEDSSIKQLK